MGDRGDVNDSQRQPPAPLFYYWWRRQKNIQTNAATGISSTLETNQNLKYM